MASAVSGGKFANGAVTAAFVHLFNAESRKPYLDKTIREGPKGVGINSGGYRTRLSLGDRIRNFFSSTVFSNLTSLRIFKFDTIKMRLAANPVGVGILGLTPNSTGGCDAGVCMDMIPPLVGPTLPFDSAPEPPGETLNETKIREQN